MASKRNRGGPAGGPSSKALTPKVTTYFGGQPSQRVNPGGADQQGKRWAITPLTAVRPSAIRQRH